MHLFGFFSPSVENFTSINYIFHSKKLMIDVFCVKGSLSMRYLFFLKPSECCINSLSSDTNFAIGHVCCSFDIGCFF